MRIKLLLSFLTISFALNSQIRFIQNDQLFNQEFYSNISIGVADMNGDLLDDVILLDEGKNLVIAYQQASNGSFLIKDFDFATNISQWSMTLGDMNNDDRMDLLIGGAYDNSKLVSQTLDRSDFVLTDTFNDDCFVQGSNTMDINNDGWLDYFVCDDDAASRIFVNDGTGKLVRNDLIDFQTIPASDNSGNYGSEWVDVNGDGYLDLYIAKCRAGVNSPTDPRRLNALYINNGDGTFTEKAEEFGLRIGDQSWSSSFGDLDNDGDFDCLIANHGSPHMILENQDNHFELLEFYSEDLESTAFQSLWSDFDNDGFLDALIVGSQPYLLRNRGDRTFELIVNPFGGAQPNSMALGDLNDDGFIDVYTNYGTGINGPGQSPDRIFINEGNDNNYVKIKLVGTESNPNAIGARITIFNTPDDLRIRQVKAGESYGIFNSLTQHFGLGHLELINYFEVEWPNGQISSYDNLPVNETYIISQEGCFTTRIAIDESDVILCDPSESYTLEAVDGYMNYEWNNGAQGRTLTVSEAGTYVATYESFAGCQFVTHPATVRYDPEVPDLFLSMESIHKCGLDTIILQAPEGYEYQWNDGSTNSSLKVANEGTYSVFMNLWCGKTAEKTFSVTQTSVVAPNVTGADIVSGETAVITSDLSNVYWCDASGLQVGEGPELMIEGLMDTTTFYCSAYESSYFSNTILNTMNMIPTGQYSPATINSGLKFDVISPVRLNAFRVETDTPGIRDILIFDNQGTEIFRQTVDLLVGLNTVILNVELPIGTNYSITTDQAINLENFGQESPQLVRSDMDVDYPYTIDGAISITSSINGPNYFYYFYNWNVDYDYTTCQSEKVAATVNVEPNAILDLDLSDAFRIQPNPAGGQYVSIAFDGDYANFLSYEVLNIQGQVLNENILDSSETLIDILSLNAGLYYIRILDKGQKVLGIKKLVIVK